MAAASSRFKILFLLIIFSTLLLATMRSYSTPLSDGDTSKSDFNFSFSIGKNFYSEKVVNYSSERDTAFLFNLYDKMGVYQDSLVLTPFVGGILPSEFSFIVTHKQLEAKVNYTYNNMYSSIALSIGRNFKFRNNSKAGVSFSAGKLFYKNHVDRYVYERGGQGPDHQYHTHYYPDPPQVLPLGNKATSSMVYGFEIYGGSPISKRCDLLVTYKLNYRRQKVDVIVADILTYSPGISLRYSLGRKLPVYHNKTQNEIIPVANEDSVKKNFNVRFYLSAGIKDFLYLSRLHFDWNPPTVTSGLNSFLYGNHISLLVEPAVIFNNKYVLRFSYATNESNSSSIASNTGTFNWPVLSNKSTTFSMGADILASIKNNEIIKFPIGFSYNIGSNDIDIFSDDGDIQDVRKTTITYKSNSRSLTINAGTRFNLKSFFLYCGLDATCFAWVNDSYTAVYESWADTWGAMTPHQFQYASGSASEKFNESDLLKWGLYPSFLFKVGYIF